MKEDLTLNIGTKYKGDGLRKAGQALKSTAKTVNDASRAIGAISSELGQMEGAVGKAAGAFSGLISTIATGGGPIALAIAGITAAIGFLVKTFKDAKEEAKEAARTMRESFAASIDAISRRMSGLSAIFAEFRRKSEDEVSNANKSNDLATRKAKAKNNITLEEKLEGTTSKYGKAREQASFSKAQSLNDEENRLSTAQNNTINAKNQVILKAEEIRALKQQLTQLMSEAEKQLATTVNPMVGNMYNQMKAEVEKAKEDVVKYGGNATTTRKEKRYTAGPNGLPGGSYEVDVEVSYSQILEETAKRLAAFKKVNEEAIKNVEAYDKTLEEVSKAEEDIQVLERERESLVKKLNNAKKEEEVVDLEVTAAKKKIERAYKEQLDAINKQEQAEKDASKLAMMEQEKKQALAGKKGVEAAELELEWTKKIAKEKEEQAKRQMDAEKGSDTEKRNYDLVVKKNESDVKAAELNLKAAKAQKDLQEKRDALEKKREELEKKRDELAKADNQTSVQRLAAHKAEQQAAKELADAEKKAATIIAQWQANPQQNFAQWNQQQQQAQREAEKQQKQQNKNFAQAQNEADRIEKRIFNRNGDLRRTASAFDIGRFAEMSDFLGFKNVNEDQIDQMKDKRDALRRKLFDENGNLKRGVAENGRDVQTFKKLDKALKNVDAVKDAEKKRKEAEEREKKRAENEDKRTQSLQKIQEDIKKLTEKAGI